MVESFELLTDVDRISLAPSCVNKCHTAELHILFRKRASATALMNQFPPRERPGLYLPVQRGRLRRWLDAELGEEEPAASVVVGQRGGALPSKGQGAHQCLMGRFTQGVQLDQPPGIVLSQSIV